MKALFGEQVTKLLPQQDSKLNTKVLKFQNVSAGSDGKFPHPLRIAESLTEQSKKIHNISFTTLGLIKFLLYGDYLKAKAPLGGASLKPLVQEDLSKYGYKPKDPFEVKQTPLGNGS